MMSVTLPRFEDCDFKSFLAASNESNIPKNYEQAISCPERERWKTAMDVEIASIYGAKTFVLQQKPSHIQPIKCGWVYTIKYGSDGNISKYKARLVAKGYSQKKGIDYEETFAPVAKIKSIRAIIALSASKGWKIYQDDVPSAFLKGNLKEDVWMEQPPGYSDGIATNYCHLKRTLYGLKQSPREWNEVVNKFMLNQRFTKAIADPCIYTRIEEKRITIVGVYVDDIIATGDCVDTFRKLLHNEFNMEDGDELNWYLGIRVQWKENGNITLDQNQ